MASSSKRLSSAEASALRSLDAAGGTWTMDQRPLWESRYWTLRLLNVLAGKGLVTEETADEKYAITPAGLREAARY